MLRNACAALGTEPKKAPYAITGTLSGDAHKVNGGWMRVQTKAGHADKMISAPFVLFMRK